MNESTGGNSGNFLDLQVSCRHLIEICPDAVFIHHLDRVVLVNEECQTLFGAKHPDDLLGRSPYELAPAEEKAFLEERYRKVIQNHQNEPLSKSTALRCDGVPIPVEHLSIPIPRADGSIAVLVVLRDISDRQRAAEDRERSENQVRMILDTAMDGIISMNEQQNIVLFNRAAEAIFGWNADQIMGRSIDTLIPTRYLSEHRGLVEQFGRGVTPSRRMSAQRTVMALRKSGEEFPIEASISHTKINDERIYTVILRDVTESAKYRQQIEQQSQMLEHVSDAVSVVDPSGRITYWNQGAQRLLGWTADEAIGHNVTDLFYQGNESQVAQWRESLSTADSWSGELKMTTRAGKTVIVDHRRTALKNETGGIKGYLCIDIDITNRKKQELLLNRSQRLESIGTLAGGIAHDLNNVLTPILMGAKLLSSDRAPANRQGLLNTMVASAQRGAGLIQKMMSFAGGIRGDRSPVRIDQIVNETRGLMEHTLPKSIQIESTVDVECPTVSGDSTEISQILMNLCINARDAMSDGGKLLIEAKPITLNGNSAKLHPEGKPGSYLLLSVTDTGTGMSSEVLDRIFDPFFTTKDIGKGTGLGLATVQGIVKSHGGFILVYSEVGRGSKFSVYLPAFETTQSDSDTTSITAAESGNGRLVLVVDDEITILQMASAALETAGYRVVTASNGDEAIAIFSQRRDEISAVLLDMMMPGMDGLQTLDQLLKLQPQVKVIACSGLGTTRREVEVLQRGAKAFLPKPYSDNQLLLALSKSLATSPH
ncbi:MAG: PAS domain S-box protein [Schlesneria sp.]